MCIARAPQQLAARLAERVERAEQREIAQRLLFETNATRELIEAVERAAAVALGDDALRFSLPKTLHRLEPQTHVVNTTGAATRDRVRAVDRMQRIAGMRALLDDRLLVRARDVNGQDRDAVPFRIAGDDRG